MTKHILFFILLVFTATHGYSQIVTQDDFEGTAVFVSSGFNTTTLFGDPNHYEVGRPSVGQFGSTKYLTSPVLTAPVSGGYTFSFSHLLHGIGIVGKTQYKIGSGAWTNFPTGTFTNSSFTEWTNPNFSAAIPSWVKPANLSLPDLVSGETFQVRFMVPPVTTDYTTGWYIDDVRVTAREKCSVDFSVNSTACTGSELSVYDLYLPSGATPLDVTWKVDGVVIGTGLTPPSYTFSTLGNHLIRIDVNMEGCPASHTETVAVVSSPTQTLSIVPSTTVCGEYSYNVIPTTPGIWSFGDGNSFNQAGTFHSYTSNGMYTACYFIDGAVCPLYQTIDVSVLPAADFSFHLNDVCNSAAGVELTIADYNTSLYTYLWEINGVIFPATAATATYLGFTGGNNIVKLKVLSQTGCLGQNIKNITIGGGVVDFTLAATACLGDIVPLGDVTDGASLYTWTVTGPVSGTYTGQYPQFLLDQTGSYTISLTATVLGCSSPAVTKVINVLAIPDASIGATLSPASCNEFTFSLLTPTTSYTSYSLTFGDATSVQTGSVLPSPLTHSYANNGFYTVHLSLNNGTCHSEADKLVQISNFATVSILGSNSFCAGSSTTLTAHISPISSPSLSFAWYKDGTTTVIGTASTLEVAEAGSYSVVVSSTDPIVCLSSPYNTASKVITSTVVPTIASHTLTTPPSCTENNGVATLTISTQSSPLSYQINTETISTTPSYVVSNLQEGMNYITIASSENSSCQSIYGLEITGGNIVYTTSTQAASCNTSNGAITIAVTTGTVSNYELYTLGSTTALNSNHSGTFTNLAPGVYTVKLVYGTGCSVDVQVIVSGTLLTVALTSPTQQLCSNGTGSVTVTATTSLSPTGSTSGVVYSWYKQAGTWILESGSSSSQTISSVGHYKVKATLGGCSSEYEFDVLPSAPILVSLLTPGQKCAGSNVVITSSVFGGQAPYTYQWTNATASTDPASATIATLTADIDVTLQITDALNCPATALVHIDAVENPLVLCTPTAAISPEQYYHIDGCHFDACAQGGTAPYNFTWYLEDQTVNASDVLLFDYDATTKQVKKQGTTTWITAPLLPSTANTNLDIAAAVLAAQQDFVALSDITAKVSFTIPYTTAIEYTHWVFQQTAGVNEIVPGLQSNGVDPFTVTTHLDELTSLVQHSHTGQTNTGNFVTGIYTVELTDAKGCIVSAQHISMNIPVSSNIIDFSFVFVDNTNKVDPPEVVKDENLIENMAEAVSSVLSSVQACLAEQESAQQSSFQTSCFSKSSVDDYFSASYRENIHQYTLFYFDRAGQLTKTVPPEGVEVLSVAQVNMLKTYRKNGVIPSDLTFKKLPDHLLTTKYRYNGIGQLLSQHTEDGVGVDGTESRFIYDGNNRLRFSQTNEQKARGILQAKTFYSYMRYDALGRVIEAGESSEPGLDFTTNAIEGITPTLFTQNETKANDLLFPANAGAIIYNTDVVISTYSENADVSYYGQEQRFLTNRISYVRKDTDGDLTTTNDTYSTYFSYDPHGNVEWLIQETPEFGQNTVRYEYDLISGKVLSVAYNEFRDDRFFHEYSYDAENRLTKAETSKDGYIWDEDVRYEFYAHGPLKRTELGEDHVQGTDMLYTAQGWLKSVNTPSLSKVIDPHHDGTVLATSWNTPTSETQRTAEDIFGMSLSYFQGDYIRTGGSFHTQFDGLSEANNIEAKDLYNGNISHWEISRLSQTGSSIDKTGKVSANIYNYDVLNRLKSTSSYEAIASVTGVGAFTKGYNGANLAFDEQYTYDKNGNIETLNRRDDQGNVMDNFTYGYNTDASGRKTKNQLKQLAEAQNSTTDYGDVGYGINDYTYDEKGNLITEKAVERMTFGTGSSQLYDVETNIEWTLTGKVKAINKKTKVLGTSQVIKIELISMYYDAMDIRVRKQYKYKVDVAGIAVADQNTYPAKNTSITYYVQDASGTPMAVYEKKAKLQASPSTLYDITLKMIEQPIYGSSRVGENKHEVEILSVQNVDLSTATELPELGALPTGMDHISEYQNWITSTHLKTSTDGDINGICQCKVRKFNYTDPNTTDNLPGSYLTNPSLTELANFLGVAENGVAVAENLEGQTQFYTVLAKNYMGATDACLVYDVEGRLMKGVELITNVDVKSKPVIVNLTGTNKYALVTRTITGKPSYHLINMDALGYGTVTAAGEVELANIAMVATDQEATTKYGWHFTGYENHIQNKTIVYATRYTPSTMNPERGSTDIVAFEMSSETSELPSEHVLYTIEDCGNTNKGELQISPDGDKLLWYQHGKNVAAFDMRLANIYSLPLSQDHLSLTDTPTIINTGDAGNYGRGLAEFTKDNKGILYSQRGVYKPTDTGVSSNVWRYEEVSSSISRINPESVYLYTQIKRGVDGKYYMPNLAQQVTTIHTFKDVDANSMAEPQIFTDLTDAAYKQSATLPTQVYKLFSTNNQQEIYTRTIGEKVYELNDHLGNVRVVITDIKMLQDVDNSNDISAGDYFYSHTISYADYYAFGMLMPTRHGSVNEKYRYQFNGMECDPEVKGDGNSYTTDFRQYDARIGRWLSRDAKEDKYPMDSPYMAFGNCPISVIDGDGREKIVVVGSENRKWNLTFALPGMKLARALKKGAGDEKVTLLLCKAGYTDNQMKRIQKYVNKNNIAIQVVTSSNDIVNYINNKSISKEQSGRKEDPITEVAIFAHGKPGELMFAYHQPDVEANYSFTKAEVQKLDKSAFKDGATITSFACRTGAGKNVDDVTRDTDPETSLAQDMANHLGVTVWAYQCRSDYEDILPSSILNSAMEACGLVDKDKTYDAQGGSWDSNAAIDNVSYPHEGSTPSLSPGMTVFKKGAKPAIVDYTSDHPEQYK